MYMAQYFYEHTTLVITIKSLISVWFLFCIYHFFAMASEMSSRAHNCKNKNMSCFCDINVTFYCNLLFLFLVPGVLFSAAAM